ncbi:MAG: type II toxin-antitoxin system VapC family toxin [Bryobacteraceae bacterium]|jgi:PIN domain nuclease of toxin-antitoxin system
MRLLLDTHVFLWWNEADPRLSRRVRQLLSDPDNSLFLSVASAWEMTLKVQSDKLGLPAAIAMYIPARLNHYRIGALPVTLEHALAASTLPAYHRDPFDRMLVAQGQVERLPIVTHDPQLRQYAVETIW